MESSAFRVEIDGPRVNRAIAELHTALVGQNVVFSERFERGIFSPQSQRRLRQLALGLCAIGLALSTYLLSAVPPGCSDFGLGLICFSAFGMLGLSFFRMREIQSWLQTKSRAWIGKRLRRYANKTLAPMRDASPVEIEYTVDEEQVGGRWLGDGAADRHWSRKLDHFAYVGETVCALFAKRTASYPRVVMLHTDRAAIVSLLETYGVEVAALPTELPDEYGLAVG